MKDVDKQHFFEILNKYRLGKASNEEKKFLETWYEVFEVSEDFVVDEGEMNAIWHRVKHNVDVEIEVYEKETKHLKMRKILQSFSVAAAILLVLAFGAYFLKKRTTVPKGEFMAQHDVIAPAANKAVLVLANGSRILLEDAAKGEIAKQQGISITKTADGEIVYTVLENGNINDQETALLNTISTPRGGQCRVILPDGTKVWVNSASSLSYPAAFKGQERLVELNGEAYFEVAKNKEMPFRVKTKIQTVEVLGTHFNINSYDDEPSIKTTLLEGSVKVLTGKNETFISPGQQAIVERQGGKITKDQEINIDKVVAWKNGIFSFENDDLKSIMRQISRWYDVEVIYSGDFPEDKFFGDISRTSNLSQVFKILELNNVHFDVKGKTIRVSEGQRSTSN